MASAGHAEDVFFFLKCYHFGCDGTRVQCCFFGVSPVGWTTEGVTTLDEKQRAVRLLVFQALIVFLHSVRRTRLAQRAATNTCSPPAHVITSRHPVGSIERGVTDSDVSSKDGTQEVMGSFSTATSFLAIEKGQFSFTLHTAGLDCGAFTFGCGTEHGTDHCCRCDVASHSPSFFFSQRGVGSFSFSFLVPSLSLSFLLFVQSTHAGHGQLARVHLCVPSLWLRFASLRASRVRLRQCVRLCRFLCSLGSRGLTWCLQGAVGVVSDGGTWERMDAREVHRERRRGPGCGPSLTTNSDRLA